MDRPTARRAVSGIANFGTLRTSARRKDLDSSLFAQVMPDQLRLIQQKGGAEEELVEEMRSFMHQVAKIEAEYSSALGKATASVLKKKGWPKNPMIPTADNIERKTVTTCWKLVLEETAERARYSQSVAEAIESQVVEPLKQLAVTKKGLLKRGVEVHHHMQEEVQKTFAELDKARKAYMELEKVAEVSRTKFDEIEDKLKKNSKGFFQSKSDLEKKLKRAEAKRTLCERRSQFARHDYMLAVAAANGHMVRYYRTDLPQLEEFIDGPFFDGIRTDLTNLTTIYRELYSNGQEQMQRMASAVSLVDQAFENNVFLLDNQKDFAEPPPIVFLPLETDTVKNFVLDDVSTVELTKQLTHLVGEVAKIDRRIASKEKTLVGVETLLDQYEKQPEFCDQETLEKSRLEATANREMIRFLNVMRSKAQESINALEDIGLHVDGVAMDDIKSDYGDDDDTQSNRGLSVPSHPAVKRRCRAIFVYRSQHVDELDIAEDEILTVIEDMGDGWLRGSNEGGTTGLFPESYVEYIQEEMLRSRSSTIGSISHLAPVDPPSIQIHPTSGSVTPEPVRDRSNTSSPLVDANCPSPPSAPVGVTAAISAAAASIASHPVTKPTPTAAIASHSPTKPIPAPVAVTPPAPSSSSTSSSRTSRSSSARPRPSSHYVVSSDTTSPLHHTADFSKSTPVPPVAATTKKIKTTPAPAATTATTTTTTTTTTAAAAAAAAASPATPLLSSTSGNRPSLPSFKPPPPMSPPTQQKPKPTLVLTQPAHTPPPVTTERRTILMIAAYENEAEADDELTFDAGDQVFVFYDTIEQGKEDGYVEGRLRNGTCGVFPVVLLEGGEEFLDDPDSFDHESSA